eukprot:GFUD01008462.1.p1 GENE.GFUD01008462.1~~GFUD01008462.1.p1  ORF type:complete len:384 (+),score=140.47 GFUD01008462.1:95-1246(+)
MQQEPNTTEVLENDNRILTDQSNGERNCAVGADGKDLQVIEEDLTECEQKVCGEGQQCVQQTEEDLLSACRRQQEILAEGMVELQKTNKNLRQEVSDLKNQLQIGKESLGKAEINLSNAKTDIRNLREENGVLRNNLKEYQSALDQCEIAEDIYRKTSPMPSPRDSTRLSVKRKSMRKIKKKDISGPTHDTVVHISGAKMIDSKLTIIDNTGLLDPRVRKFLALAGVNEGLVVNNPEKLEVIEKFAKDENLLEAMEKRKRLKKQFKSQDKPQTFAYAPPPPPMPPPPKAAESVPILKISPKPDRDLTDSKKQPADMFEMIRSGSFHLRPVDKEMMIKNRKTAQEKDDGELLSALKGALSKIDDASGFSSDDDSLDTDIANDDW